MKWLNSLFEEHQGARRIALVWAMSLITWVTIQLFTDPTGITGASAAAYATVTGVLGIVIGFYQHLRGQDDRRQHHDKQNS